MALKSFHLLKAGGFLACYGVSDYDGGMTLRIALFSDVHGNLTALRAVLAALERHPPLQMVIAAGDHVLAGPRPAATWDALQRAGVACILGNEDIRLWDAAAIGDADSPWAPLTHAQLTPTVTDLGPARLAALRALPRSLRLGPAPDEDLLVVHANIHGPTGWALNPGMADADVERLYSGAHARIICCGHYHAASLRTWGNTTIVNVASVSIPTDREPLAGYTILEWDGSWRIAQYRVPFDADDEARAFADSPIPDTIPGWRPPAT